MKDTKIVCQKSFFLFFTECKKQNSNDLTKEIIPWLM